MSNEVFPIQYAALGSRVMSEQSTYGIGVKNGYEWRNANWDTDKPRFRINLIPLTVTERQEIIDFLKRHQNANESFLFTEVDGDQATHRVRLATDVVDLTQQFPLRSIGEVEFVTVFGEG